MAVIIYVEHDGTEHEVDVPNGDTIMEGAMANGIPGIDAVCGGICVCGTCSCYIDFDQQAEKQVPPAEGQELETLNEVLHRKENSRLGCQIQVSDMMDGLKVYLPEEQQ
jgi:2Fe-2S ferredoxin